MDQVEKAARDREAQSQVSNNFLLLIIYYYLVDIVWVSLCDNIM